MVDEEALRSFDALPEDPPPLRVAADCATKQVSYTTDQFPNCRGWMELDAGEIPDVWFQRCSRMKRGGDWVLECGKGRDDAYW